MRRRCARSAVKTLARLTRSTCRTWALAGYELAPLLAELRQLGYGTIAALSGADADILSSRPSNILALARDEPGGGDGA